LEAEVSSTKIEGFNIRFTQVMKINIKMPIRQITYIPFQIFNKNKIKGKETM